MDGMDTQRIDSSSPDVGATSSSKPQSVAIVTTATGVFTIYDAWLFGPERVVGHLADESPYDYQVADGDRVRLETR